MTKPHTLGNRIAQARREMAVRVRRDISQADVAKAIGVSGAALSQWESDAKSPREDALAKLAAYLGVTPAYLRYGVAPSAGVLDYVAKEAERPVSELIHKAPAKKASAKRKRTG